MRLQQSARCHRQTPIPIAQARHPLSQVLIGLLTVEFTIHPIKVQLILFAFLDFSHAPADANHAVFTFANSSIHGR